MFLHLRDFALGYCDARFERLASDLDFGKYLLAHERSFGRSQDVSTCIGSKMAPLRSPWTNLLKLGRLLSLQKHAVDAIVCIFNLSSVSQAVEMCLTHRSSHENKQA